MYVCIPIYHRVIKRKRCILLSIYIHNLKAFIRKRVIRWKKSSVQIFYEIQWNLVLSVAFIFILCVNRGISTSGSRVTDSVLLERDDPAATGRTFFGLELDDGSWGGEDWSESDRFAESLAFQEFRGISFVRGLPWANLRALSDETLGDVFGTQTPSRQLYRSNIDTLTSLQSFVFSSLPYPAN